MKVRAGSCANQGPAARNPASDSHLFACVRSRRGATPRTPASASITKASFLLDEFLLRAQTGCGADLAPNLLRSSPAGPLVGAKGEDILGSLSRSPCGSGAIAGGGHR